MKRTMLPVIGLLAAIWATFSIVRTAPQRERTDPPMTPPVSALTERVAAVGLVEASSENISIGTPLSGVVTGVFVSPGQTVRKGQPLFDLDTRQLAADLDVKERVVAAAQASVAVRSARLEELRSQVRFVDQVKDKRAISAEEASRRHAAVATAIAELAQAQAEVATADAEVRSVRAGIARSTIVAPLEASVLQVKLRIGEFAPAAAGAKPLIVLGRLTPLHVRVDVDEHEGWRIQPGARAVGHVRGNPQLETPLTFVRFEPLVVPKTSLTGDNTERVDTRVLQVIYRVERGAVTLFVGQQLDVFIAGAAMGGAAR